jgi:hypothetical protein
MILNVCLGHKAFPNQYAQYIDLMLSPLPISAVQNFILVPDHSFGENGSSLSEYVQLLWLYQNLENFIQNKTHIRVFHYRRFVSDAQIGIGEPCSLPFAKRINQDQLSLFHNCFDRCGDHELVNSIFKPHGGMLNQYAGAHVLSDILDFSQFLYTKGILSSWHVAAFLREESLIPASSISVLTISNFKWISSILLKASDFMNQTKFVPREGYQRRNMGFLLERLNSYLLLEGMRQRRIANNSGVHMIISESHDISITHETSQ